MNDVLHQQHTIKRNNTRYFLCRIIYVYGMCMVFLCLLACHTKLRCFLLHFHFSFTFGCHSIALHSAYFPTNSFMILRNDVHNHFSAIFLLHHNSVNYCFLFVVVDGHTKSWKNVVFPHSSSLAYSTLSHYHSSFMLVLFFLAQQSLKIR